MKTKQASSSSWYNRRSSAAALTILSFVLGYGMALRAIDTGSLQQYALVIVLIGLAINRGLRTIRSRVKEKV